MSKHISTAVFVLLITIVSVSSALPYPALKLPYLPYDNQWYVSQGNNAPQCQSSDPTCYYDHWLIKGMVFAWDFSIPGNVDLGYPVIAPANGVITDRFETDETCGLTCNNKWGKGVIIEYNDKSFGKITHMLKVFVTKGQKVTQGSTGNSSAAHIHYQTQSDNTWNGSSTSSSFSDSDTIRDNGIPQEGKFYLSGNTLQFDTIYNGYNSILIGLKEGLPHWYYNWKNTDLYDSARNEVPNNIYIQDLQGGEWRDGAIVYDALGGARQAYLIRSGFWHEWSKDSWGLQKGGPRSELGAPITEEYPISSSPPQSRQDFQRGYLIYTQGANQEITPTISKMPGIYDDGWHPETSYAFADAYANNWARKTVGEPDTNLNETPYVHEWRTTTNACVTIQDFWNGSYGDNAIILNKNINIAFVVRSRFWEWYKDKSNNGPFTLGAPLEDEKNGIWNGTQCVLSQQAQQEFDKGLLIIGTDGKVAFLLKGTTLQKALAKENMCYPPPDTIPPAAPAGLTMQQVN